MVFFLNLAGYGIIKTRIIIIFKKVFQKNQRGKIMADWVVVDDDETNCKMAGRILSMANMRVTAVKSGYALLEYLRDKAVPDLILLDIKMPGMDGIQTLETAREDRQIRLEGVPVIALTAHAVTGAKKTYLSHGFSDYLTKPVDRELLFGLLKNGSLRKKLGRRAAFPTRKTDRGTSP